MGPAGTEKHAQLVGRLVQRLGLFFRRIFFRLKFFGWRRKFRRRREFGKLVRN
jgi:hypothetical protein